MKMGKSEADNNAALRDLKIFNDIQNFIRGKINNSDGRFFESGSGQEEVAELVRRSAGARESNSAIVCGPPGCGKTALVNHIIEELILEKAIIEETTFIIRLNGLLHTDDRLALKDITRQLKIAEGNESFTFSSFQENLIHLLEKLKVQKEDNFQPFVLFILDEFHMFCGHKNQILLYNLFDIVQSSKAHVCVLGLTYCTDIMDLLEKRVLSRFSHRMIWLNQVNKLEERLKMFKNIFTLKPEDLPNVDEIYKVLWNLRVDELITSKEVADTFKKQLDIDPSETKFRNMLFKLFITVTFDLPLLTAENIKAMFTPSDFHLLILTNLCMLEMALVIAIKHQTVNYDREPFNFEMIYAQYLKFCKKNSTTLITERSVVLKAFQRLQELEIVVPLRKTIGNCLGKVPMEYQLYNLNLTEEQVSEGVKLNSDLTTDLRQWALYSV